MFGRKLFGRKFFGRKISGRKISGRKNFDRPRPPAYPRSGFPGGGPQGAGAPPGLIRRKKKSFVDVFVAEKRNMFVEDQSLLGKKNDINKNIDFTSVPFFPESVSEGFSFSR